MDIVCPRDRAPLTGGDRVLRCAAGHEYPVVNGIPVLLLGDVEQTHWLANRSLDIAAGNRERWPRAIPWQPSATQHVHPYVSEMIVKTNGMMYRHLRGNLDEYPIPDIRLPKGKGALLDIGCSWGRWSVAAARKGYSVTGIDPDLYAVMAARDVARQLGITAEFVVADARFLPFADESADVCFSYSVLQHLSRDSAKTALSEIGRVLRSGSVSLVQMASRNGARSLFHLAKRGFSRGEGFDVRYWSPSELKKAFEAFIGESSLRVDGFFGLGIQPADRRLMPMRNRAVIAASEALRASSNVFRPLVYLADSIYVESKKAQRRPTGGSKGNVLR
jgi:SAM-dependent methyltransferase